MKIEGRVWKFGDDINTDLIIPARYLNVSDEKELARNCFADDRPEFSTQVKRGDILVAGRNFGCGSSREHAPIAIKASGVGVVVAKSFARIFYRNAFNIGLPLLESEEVADVLTDGSRASIDLSTGKIRSEDGKIYQTRPVPDFMRELIRAGGLVKYIRKKKLGKAG